MANRNRKSGALKRIQSQINITPLIDILLVLLVIFMVVTPVTPTGLNAEIPKPAAPTPIASSAAPETLVLSVDRDGVITLNHNRVQSTAELIPDLQDIFRTRADRTIFIQGSGELEFDGIAQIIDAARGGGANRIGLMTEEIR